MVKALRRDFAGNYAMAPEMPPRVVELHYRVEQVADLLACSRDSVERAIREWDESDRKSGLGPSYLVAGKRIVPAGAVHAWLERLRVSR